MPGRSRRGRPPHDDVLTPTEWRVVHAVQHGMSNREIAARRGISLDAVKYHVANAVAKLGLANRQALRRWFRVPGTSALRLQERPIMSAQEKPAPESILYLRVADIRTAYELLRSRGVEFADAPHLIHRHADGTEEWMAHFHDPEGRPLAIMSQVKP